MATENPKPSQQPIVVFSNNQGDTANHLATMIGKYLNRSCVTRYLNDEENIECRPLVLVDCGCYTPNRIQSWLAVKNRERVPPVALYDIQVSSLHESLLEWPCVRGFFYRDTEQPRIIGGVRCLLQGDFWLPRRLLHGYLERTRRIPRHTIKTPELLTRRELEILSLLENGATNAAMAKAMVVSEHTIKTHLYNIYRKIDVSNRIEAINWSRQNISARVFG